MINNLEHTNVVHLEVGRRYEVVRYSDGEVKEIRTLKLKKVFLRRGLMMLKFTSESMPNTLIIDQQDLDVAYVVKTLEAAQ